MQNLMVGAGWRVGRPRRTVPILEKGKEKKGLGRNSSYPRSHPKSRIRGIIRKLPSFLEPASSMCQSRRYSLKPDYSLRPQGAVCSPLGWGRTYKQAITLKGVQRGMKKAQRIIAARCTHRGRSHLIQIALESAKAAYGIH